ncbi:MAG: c-type cytochrome [Anaerolineales bacterium]
MTRNLILLGTILVLFSLFASACSPGLETSTVVAEDTPAEEEEQSDEADHTEEEEQAEELEALVGNMVRGGLLYDKWWVIAPAEVEDDHEGSGEAPEGDQPLWSTQSSNTRSGNDTWRCKECHGWDYMGVDGAYGSGSHMTGFPGINGFAGSDPAEALAVLQGNTNSDHDFSGLMAEQDLIDLALFISEGQIDYTVYVNDDKSSTGDAAGGELIYNGACSGCHGPDGSAINFHGLDDPELLGHIASGNPWEFIHKVRFGQPGWPMPSAIVNNWTLDLVSNVLAFSQGFSEELSYTGGGAMYDKWWVVAGVDEPVEDHPLWATQDTNERSGKDSWRCKECHGWDYKGLEGAYGSGSHFTGFTGVLSAAEMSTEDLTAWMDGTNNPNHDFASLMDDVFLQALIAFMKTEMEDLSGFVGEDKTVEGDRSRGQSKYDMSCAACHGVDGTRINFGDDEDPEYLGTVASGNPWETFHKALNGQPGEPMPNGISLGWTIEDILDLVSYVQTMPAE